MLQQPTAVLESAAYFCCWCSLEVEHMWLQQNKISADGHDSYQPTVIQHVTAGNAFRKRAIRYQVKLIFAWYTNTLKLQISSSSQTSCINASHNPNYPYFSYKSKNTNLCYRNPHILTVLKLGTYRVSDSPCEHKSKTAYYPIHWHLLPVTP
jgi:hypothetical protein